MSSDVVATTKKAPIAVSRLTEIATMACEKAIGNAKCYDHPKTAEWNNTIINTILETCIEETKAMKKGKNPRYKFVCNSSIVQHTAPSEDDDDDDDDETEEGAELKEKEYKSSGGRRGMHSATAAYWDDAQDGMWSFKYDGAASKGLDIIIMLVWVHV
ncbi:Dynein light chain Tctex-type [Ceratocystis lukuohia]|uniref:Dynein light chain Tctex-type n=2 Tax=Ceratocystis TaxID=5157 RepID=A0A0F8BSB1_CERFI|nr:Dynein light chain Tctex-type [Ceratocystis platani]